MTRKSGASTMSPTFQAPNQEGGNQRADGHESSLYYSDEFRIYCFKVLPCSKRFSHDWVSCPFAHPGEKARRRCLRSMPYTATACTDMLKTGECPRGDACSMTHSVFEYWLHPQRYRTQLCNDGKDCRRKICFFAHGLDELRVPTLAAGAAHPGSPGHQSSAGTAGQPGCNLSPLSGLTMSQPTPSLSPCSSNNCSINSDGSSPNGGSRDDLLAAMLSGNSFSSNRSMSSASSSASSSYFSQDSLVPHGGHMGPGSFTGASQLVAVTAAQLSQQQQQQQPMTLQAQLQQLMTSATNDSAVADLLSEIIQELRSRCKDVASSLAQQAAGAEREAHQQRMQAAAYAACMAAGSSPLVASPCDARMVQQMAAQPLMLNGVGCGTAPQLLQGGLCTSSSSQCSRLLAGLQGTGLTADLSGLCSVMQGMPATAAANNTAADPGLTWVAGQQLFTTGVATPGAPQAGLVQQLNLAGGGCQLTPSAGCLSSTTGGLTWQPWL